MDLFDAPAPTDDPRARLIHATIGEIEARGAANVTVRHIVAAAGLNLSAVNYYFGSKAALLEAVRRATAEHLVADTRAVLERMPSDPIRYFAELMHYYLEGARRYPHLTKAHLHEAFTADDYSGPFPTLLAPILEEVAALVHGAVPGASAAEAERRVIAAFSAALFPAFFGRLFQPLKALDTEVDRRDYARAIAEQTFAPPRP